VCHREKSQLVFSSDTQSSTPFDTQSGTPSDTLSSTPSCTKTMGDLAVMVLVASDGRIKYMGFSRARGLQLLNLDNSIWIVMLGDYWLASFLEATDS
jgi:hypothetical protein